MKTKIIHKARPVELGEYIVADPRICHGRPTFKRTRVMVPIIHEDHFELISQRQGFFPRTFE